MPRLTPENLDYIARGCRRILYGPLCEGPPSCKAEADARNAERAGQVLVFVFGPANVGYLSGEHYAHLCASGIIDYYVPPIRRDPEKIQTIESQLAATLEHYPPPCDIVVCLFPKARPTHLGATMAAYGDDPDYRACVDRAQREKPAR